VPGTTGVKVALVVPGGVDPSGEHRVIPALLALLSRLASHHDVHVFALYQQDRPATWQLAGARIHNIGSGRTRLRAVRAISAEHAVRPFQLVHSIWSASPGLVAVAAGRLLRIPTAVHLTGGEIVALPAIGFGGRQTWKGRIREQLVLRMATAITASSFPMVQAIEALGLTASRLPLGVDLCAWPPRVPVRRDPGAPARLIHVGSLNRVKDQPTLLRALAELRRSGVNFELDVVGEDTLGGEVQAFAAQLGLAERVRFHGFLTQRQLRPLLESAHLMILSSRHEAGPYVLLEAAVAGVPTVGTAVGHIAEWAPEAAISVPVADWSALAAAIRQVLSDDDVRLRMARAAHERALAEDADHTACCFEALYGRLVDCHRRRITMRK
jgi:glycosyltransferase involved in cell wall biosynthesis